MCKKHHTLKYNVLAPPELIILDINNHIELSITLECCYPFVDLFDFLRCVGLPRASRQPNTANHDFYKVGNIEMKKFVYAFVGLATAALVGSAQAGTLEDVQARGSLNCIVTTGLAGFSNPDDNAVWTGFDVDFCRATAAAVLGDSEKWRAVPATGSNRFTLLNSGEGDLLYRVTTITFSRDVGIKLTFLGVNYYDGQGFMVNKSLGVDSVLDLDGASICVQTGTTTELNMADYFRSNGMTYEAIPGSTSDETREGLDAGRCDALTTDASALAAQRTGLTNPAEFVILPEIISKEPLGPAVRQGDDAWADVVRWILYATIAAEEMGITSANVESFNADTKNPQIKRLLGIEGNQGAELGLDADWAKRVIKQVGNYGEIFARHIGSETPLALDRGLNAQWTDGGLMYSPPFN